MRETTIGKIKREHLARKAFDYIRQSTPRQVRENAESTKRQYALRERLVALGWDEGMIEVIDSDLGQSGSGTEGRHGFQYLVSEVSLGRVGIIAGIEVSRLSRSSSDWGRLLQIAALSDTLIMDEDGIYNVNDFNDRLLLGLKGTLSEAELHYLKSRMRGGLLNKAKRGELKRGLPIGYVYDEDGQIRKDPDAQVQEAISHFFNAFRRIGSACGLVREYNDQGCLFPSRPHRGFKTGELAWVGMTLSRALAALKNPMYAGIYAYGMTQVKHSISGRKNVPVPKEQYHAWLPDSHPPYISAAQFESNGKQLGENARPNPGGGHGGAVREGASLLQGIALCGNCGRRMTLRYGGSATAPQPIYTCEHGRRERGGKPCQYVSGGNIDLAVGALLLDTINPLTVNAAISIQREMAGRKDEILRMYSQQLERARHDMDIAKRRYLSVDPGNRLVAAELERDWNQKAVALESARAAYEQKCDMEMRAVDEETELSLSQLIADFPKIWADHRTPPREKKRIARHILEDVTITSGALKITLGIRFKGGSTRVLEIPKASKSLNLISRENEAASEIEALLHSGLEYKEIAEALNDRGMLYGLPGKPFDTYAVTSIVYRHKLPTRTDIAMSGVGEGWLTAKEKMEELGIDKNALYRMRKSGRLITKEFNYRGASYLYKAGDSPG